MILLISLLATCLVLARTGKAGHCPYTGRNASVCRTDTVTDSLPPSLLMLTGPRDSMRYSLRNMQDSYRKAFHLKDETFRERMNKDPWLGDLLKEIFFRR